VRWSPQNIPARLELAQIELDSAEYGKAVTTAEAVISYRPDERTAHLIRGIALRGMKKYPEARAELTTLLTADPKNPDVLYHLAMLDDLQGKWKEAEEGYRKSYEANPSSTRSLVAMAMSMMARNQANQALAMLQAEARKSPERNDLRFAADSFATRANRPDVAIPDLEALLVKLPAQSPQAAETHTLLAECYLRTKKVDKALEHVEIALKLQPESAMVLHYVGLVYDNLGRHEEARKFYEASLKQNADDGVVLNNLAYLIVENGGDPDLALTYAQRARQKMPHEPGFADTVGVIYMKKNLVDNALEIFETLVREKPGEAVFHRHLGEALLKKGETAKGRRELQLALASQPSSEEAAKTKELLAKAGT
jgi:tetratricopeptide (TPR) repeat protein